MNIEPIGPGHVDDLEDLFVQPEARGHGLGKALLAHLASLAIERDCARLEWWVLDWNEPSIGFYKSLGAKFMDEWTVMRVDGPALAELGKSTLLSRTRNSVERFRELSCSFGPCTSNTSPGCRMTS